MSKWIEEKGGGEIDQILEGHGTQFVVRFESYPQPQRWRIKESPFLLDVHKSFVNLGEAKEYCERRYQELFGQREELTRLRAELAKANEERDKYKEIAISETNETGKLQLSNIDSLAQITRLRADLAAVTEERDRMREALKPFLIERRPEHNVYGYKMVFVKPDDFRRARAAIEGVTKSTKNQKGVLK